MLVPQFLPSSGLRMVQGYVANNQLFDKIIEKKHSDELYNLSGISDHAYIENLTFWICMNRSLPKILYNLVERGNHLQSFFIATQQFC